MGASSQTELAIQPWQPWAAAVGGAKAMILAKVTHYSAELYCNGVRFAPALGAVGKEKTKNLNHRVRDRVFNQYLAKVWIHKIKNGQTRFAEVYKALKKYEK